ncbi:hypothetical protein BKA56DRAFT_738518 [Ilyonectria sp. MPI-CAGE-AT-0026]|nr:hypothetical protein BKA56DRAFT_738518 [Ilyonectria sp. MPI-CAGE-AT-0026]
MPYRLDTHLLTVDANAIHKVDSGNAANLYNMWPVFSRCADPVDQGRRQENLSWRLWRRETFVVDNPNLPQNIPSEIRITDLPQLSGGVEALAEEEAVDLTSVSAPLEICRPRIRRQDSFTNRHIDSEDFEKFIISIAKDSNNDILWALTRIFPVVAPLKESLPASPAFTRAGSNTESQRPPESISDRSKALSEPSPITRPHTTVVRGFSPSHIPAPRTIPSAVQCAASDMIPEPTSSPAPKPVQPKKQPTKFIIGGASFSSTEQAQSLDNHKPVIPIVKKSMFQIGGSSENDGILESALASSRPSSLLSPQKKQASFSTNVMTRTIEDEAAVDSDTDYIDESAIDDDDNDSSDWEDSVEDSGKSSMDDKFFQRVDSKPNLTSRRSLITLMLAKYGRVRNLGNHASQSTSAIPRSRMAPNEPSLGASPNDSDEAPLMMKGMRHPTLKPIHEIPRSSAQPIVSHAGHVQGQAALSPRTTRRNMLATELTESLRRHVLRERWQNFSKVYAVRSRWHTSHDVANLKQYPERSCIKTSEGVSASHWNQYPPKEASNDYHSKGW